MSSTYNPDKIFNTDETELYYRAMPDGSLCYAYKKAMDHITVLRCAI